MEQHPLPLAPPRSLYAVPEAEAIGNLCGPDWTVDVWLLTTMTADIYILRCTTMFLGNFDALANLI